MSDDDRFNRRWVLSQYGNYKEWLDGQFGVLFYVMGISMDEFQWGYRRIEQPQIDMAVEYVKKAFSHRDRFFNDEFYFGEFLCFGCYVSKKEKTCRSCDGKILTFPNFNTFSEHMFTVHHLKREIIHRFMLIIFEVNWGTARLIDSGDDRFTPINSHNNRRVPSDEIDSDSTID